MRVFFESDIINDSFLNKSSYSDAETVPKIREVIKRPVITVGSYDGVHVGHRKILEQLCRVAAQRGGESVVVTFDPHPRKVVHNLDQPLYLLNSLSEKINLLESVGVDNLIVINFTKEFSKISSYDFLKHYLIDIVGLDTLIIGYNHHFGHNREGDFSYLENLRTEYGFNLCEISKCDVDNEKVSSTIIRELISEGDFQKANKYLGAPYPIVGILGDNGRVILDEPCKLLPVAGKYEGKIYSNSTETSLVIEVSDSSEVVIDVSVVAGVSMNDSVRLTFS